MSEQPQRPDRPEQTVVDEIAALVDWQLAQGECGGSLPSGCELVYARSAAGGAALAAVISGVSVAEAYEHQGIALPPVGTRVNDPVPFESLWAGDVGMCIDDLAVALGNGRAMVSGLVQSISEVSSAPGFLGWFDPTKSGSDSADHRPVHQR